jgi:hypothetical protein
MRRIGLPLLMAWTVLAPGSAFCQVSEDEANWLRSTKAQCKQVVGNNQEPELAKKIDQIGHGNVDGFCSCVAITSYAYKKGANQMPNASAVIINFCLDGTFY